MEVELVGADFVGNELQRCGLLLGASGESAPPCPALCWPTCDMCAALCDPLGVRMQVEDRLAGGVGREVGGWAGLELGVGAGAVVFWEVLGSRGRRGGGFCLRLRRVCMQAFAHVFLPAFVPCESLCVARLLSAFSLLCWREPVRACVLDI